MSHVACREAGNSGFIQGACLSAKHGGNSDAPCFVLYGGCAYAARSSRATEMALPVESGYNNEADFVGAPSLHHTNDVHGHGRKDSAPMTLQDLAHALTEAMKQGEGVDTITRLT